MNYRISLFVFCWVYSLKSFGQSETVTTSVVVHFDKREESHDEQLFLPRIDEFLSSSAISTGLQTGSEAINRSVESLMDAVFYSLLDQKLPVITAPSYQIGLSISRQVFAANQGSYIIVDKGEFGPEYQREVFRYGGIPITLGNSEKLEVADIYLRNDASRLVESHTENGFRSTLNNWLGILPVLTRILPPSFNPNELYDPLRMVSQPFTIPLEKESFDQMEEGSIRSYALKGGINLSFDAILKMFPQLAKEAARKAIGLNLLTNAFITGEFRVNIYKIQANRARVGIVKTTSTGHSIPFISGKTLFLLSGSIPQWNWAGIPAPILPITSEISLQKPISFDIIYEFDLSKSEQLDEYKNMVRGNAGNIRNGVFLLSREKSSRITTHKAEQRFYVYRSGITSNNSIAEIKLMDNIGEYYILESSSNRKNEEWHILNGEKSMQFSYIIDSRVLKDGHKYTFSDINNPFHIILKLQIIDNFTDTRELRRYKSILESFLNKSIPEIPKFNNNTDEQIIDYQLSHDLDLANNRHITIPLSASPLGKFGAEASIVVDFDQFKSFISLSKDHKIELCSEAYKLDKLRLHRFATYFSSFMFEYGYHSLTLPFQFISNSKIANANYIDAYSRINTNPDLSSRNPLKLISELNEWLNSKYPEAIPQLLYRSNQDRPLKNSIHIFTKPFSNIDPALKSAYQKLNGIGMATTTKDQHYERYNKAEQILSSFSPKSRFSKSCHIDKIEILTAGKIKNLLTRIKTSQCNSASKKYSFYIKVEQTGKLSLGNFVLFEDVIYLESNSALLERSFDEAMTFPISLSDLSSIKGDLIYEQAFKLGGNFKLTVAVASNDQDWSNAAEVRFRYKDDQLLPL